MPDIVPASRYDAAVETAIGSAVRGEHVSLPSELPDELFSAIMSLEEDASQADQDHIRDLWSQYKIDRVDEEDPLP